MPVLGKLRGGPEAARNFLSLAGRDVVASTLQPSAVVLPSIASTAEKMCAAPGCAVRWSMLPWKKNRRRPIFEQDFGCSSQCLSKLVQSAVRRETGDGLRAETDQPHRHRIPLGLVLLAQGWITHPQLQAALDQQRASGRGRIGDWLVQGCGLEEQRIAHGLGVQWNCPVLSTEAFSPAAMAPVMPKRFVAEFGLLPLRIAGSRLLYLAFEERMNAAAAFGVAQMSGLKVESGPLAASQFADAKASLLAADGVALELKQVADREALTAAIVKALGQHQPLASRLVRVHQYYWLRMWLESGAMSGVGQVPPSPEDMQDYLFTIG